MWWGDYLVRYLMPSIAGMLFVLWMDRATGGLLSCLTSDTLVGNIKTGEINSAKLLFLFLLGNLICYVASLPILVFHVTRVIDFGGIQARPRCLFWSYVVLALVFVAAMIGGYCPQSWKWLPYILALLFSGYQVWRLLRVMTYAGNSDTSLGYRFQHQLAQHKGAAVQARQRG